MSIQAYPVVVYKDPESDYGTEVPDLPGCYSAGSTLSEALEETREAVYAHLEGMAKDGEVAPVADLKHRCLRAQPFPISR